MRRDLSGLAQRPRDEPFAAAGRLWPGLCLSLSCLFSVARLGLSVMPGVVHCADDRIDFLGGGESQYGVAACVTALGCAEFAENEKQQCIAASCERGFEFSDWHCCEIREFAIGISLQRGNLKCVEGHGHCALQASVDASITIRSRGSIRSSAWRWRALPALASLTT